MAPPEPLDINRLRNFLRKRDLAATQTDETTWVMPRVNALYRVTLHNPQVLQLGAQWRGFATSEKDFHALRNVILECNSTRTSPKSFILPLEDHHGYSVVGEANCLLLSGMTTDQFYSYWESAITSIASFLHLVESRVPQLVTWDSEEFLRA